MTTHRLVPLALLAFASVCVHAGNTDPADDGHQWAWSENAGWINAQPLGPGGPGAEFADFHVTGFLWSENLGWINLGCRADGNCDRPGLGVRNDGQGTLSGWAWAENAGFIAFAPAGGGVRVSSAGLLEGRAWGENIGWIEFSVDPAYAIRTSWSCIARPAPAGVPRLDLAREGATALLAWTAVPNATDYDVVAGGLAALRAAGGDFSTAEFECLARKTGLRTASDDEPGLPGDGRWYLVRGVNCAAPGTWNDASAPGRDPLIAAAPGTCP